MDPTQTSTALTHKHKHLTREYYTGQHTLFDHNLICILINLICPSNTDFWADRWQIFTF